MSMKDIFQRGGEEGRNYKMPTFRFKKSLWIILGLLVLAFILFPAFARFYTDYLWFDALEFSSVFWTMILPQWVLFAVATAVAFVVFSTIWISARRGAKKLDEAGETPLHGKGSGLIVLAASILLAVMNGLGVRGEWAMVLRFLNRTPFGHIDPIFGKDVGFYVFELPFYSFLQDWLLGVLVTALLGSALIYVMGWLPRIREENRFSFPPQARRHLTFLGAIAVFAWGAGFWIERFDLLFSPSGAVFGAGYTDIHARLLGINIMLALSAIVGVLLLMNAFKRTWKLAIVAVVLLVASNIVIRGVYPGIVQKYIVEPNEFQREEPYIRYNIDSTLKAYDLDTVKTVPFYPDTSISRKVLEEEESIIRNIRLWDYGPLLRSYKQLQEIRSYYDFPDVDIDRYEFDGDYRQVVLAARELDVAQLQNPTWMNMHLEFTHGYGIVMNYVNEIDPEGKPLLIIQDIPPKIEVPVDIDRPQIYYGEKRQPYVLVKTKILEFDYPMGGANVRTTYEGTGGVEIGSLLRRLAFAVRFTDSQILFTDAILPESRIMFHRSIEERIRKVAPFLLYDSDPYLTVQDGRLVWIQDAYTVTGRYPYSEPVDVGAGMINYIRNSVKVAVDAYDGDLTFYITDPEDPLVQNWARIFPDLFTPAEEAPESYSAHWRYPRDLFTIQSDIFRTYHMKDTNTFYNKEDVWEFPRAGTAGTMEPYYVIMRLAGYEEPEFLVMSPFTPSGRDNMIAWIAGRSDEPNYSELLVYEFPKQELIYGPRQVEALIDQHPEISAQLSLWTQRGSDVIRGNLLVIPMGESLLYVQPLYLRAERSDLPELRRVIVSSGGRVAWDETLNGALERLLGSRPVAAPAPDQEGEIKMEVPRPDRPFELPELPEGTAAELARRAQEHFEAAQEAARRGDWARYGEEIEKLEAVIRRLVVTTGVTPEDLP